MINKYKWEFMIILSLIIWWLFPIITKNLVTQMNFIFALWFSALFAALYFLIIWIFKKEWKYFRKNDNWKYLLIHALINWIIFYILIFYWLQYTSAINWSIFWLTEIFFSYLFFGFIFTDNKSKFNEIAWTFLIVLWALYIIYPWELIINKWDIFIILSMLIIPFGNQCTKLSVRTFSPNFVMLIRSIITSIFLLFVGSIYYEFPNYQIINDNLIELIISWILIFWISKTLWVSAMKYVTVPKASSFLPLYPVLTIGYWILFYNTIPNLNQLIWLLPMVIWVFILFNTSIFNNIKSVIKKED
jgi:drug/metabolite transporter (DMT)-like permease